MDEILNLGIAEMAGISFDCSCGRRHSVDINRIVVGKNVADEVVNAVLGFGTGQIFLMADNNTYRVYGEKVEKLLKGNGFNINSFVFESTHPLVPDETALGRLLAEIHKNTSLIIAVGSGSLNDLARFISFQLKIPYIIVCTAPSMDGYASTVSPLIIEGYKMTYEAVYPYAIFADIDIVKDAPEDMVHAGFGDIIGKLTALGDWELSRRLKGEYFCETCARLVRNALKKCMDNAEGIAVRDEKAIGYLMEALILSGVAMGLAGNSRPASGAEHHVAHYWEMDALARGAGHPLHGNSVGAASVAIASIYEQIREKHNIDVGVPKPAEIRGLLRKAGACDTPAVLGIDIELFKRSILHAMEIRPRYTVFHLASESGLLAEFAEVLTGRLYEQQ